MATCSMKYPTSAEERSMNLLLSAEIRSIGERNLLVDTVHGGVALVGGESVVALHGAAEENTEVLVQVGEESAVALLAEFDLRIWRYSLLVGAGAVGWHVHHERNSSTIVEEVDCTTDITASV